MRRVSRQICVFTFPPIVESRNGINLRVARRGATGASGGGGEIGKGKRGGDSRTEQKREAKEKDGNAWRTGLALGGRCGLSAGGGVERQLCAGGASECMKARRVPVPSVNSRQTSRRVAARTTFHLSIFHPLFPAPASACNLQFGSNLHSEATTNGKVPDEVHLILPPKFRLNVSSQPR